MRGRYQEPEWERLDLVSSGPGATLNARIPFLPDLFARTVPQEAVDLFRIAAFAYWVDQMVSRRAEVEVFGSNWSRHFVLWVPVADAGRWSRPEVKAALEECLRYGTDDRWDFHFVSGAVPPQPYLFAAGEGVSPEPTTVVLFSGGTDSLCAVVEEALGGRQPLLISHSPSTRGENRQTALISALRASRAEWWFQRHKVEVSKSGVAERERTQRTRGFLYSAIGASVAAGFGLTDVVVADNGFVSVGLPISGQAIGAKMSRTTHPKFQALFNRLLDGVLPGISIRNPLLFRTRKEALRVLDQEGLRSLTGQTHSCAASSRLSGERPHCGTCSQCLDRRIGFVGAGLQGFDGLYMSTTSSPRRSKAKP